VCILILQRKHDEVKTKNQANTFSKSVVSCVKPLKSASAAARDSGRGQKVEARHKVEKINCEPGVEFGDASNS